MNAISKFFREVDNDYKSLSDWWNLFYIGVALVLAVIFVAGGFAVKYFFESFFNLYLIIATCSFVVLFLAVIYWAFMNSYWIIDEGDEATVERMGKYFTTWKAGPHLAFPDMFGLIAVVNVWRVKERELDFSIITLLSDGAEVTLKCTLFFKIYDSYKAFYNIPKILEFESVRHKIEGAVRKYVAPKTLDELNESGDQHNLPTILSGEPLTSDDISYRKKDIYLMFRSWGIEPLSFAMAPPIPPASLQEMREVEFKAKSDFEAVKYKAKTMEAMAEAEKNAMINKSEGHKSEVAKLMEIPGMTIEQATAIILNKQKFPNGIPNSANITFINSDGDSNASAGAGFGAGMNSTKKS